jgi:hypothetical protein
MLQSLLLAWVSSLMLSDLHHVLEFIQFALIGLPQQFNQRDGNQEVANREVEKPPNTKVARTATILPIYVNWHSRSSPRNFGALELFSLRVRNLLVTVSLVQAVLHSGFCSHFGPRTHVAVFSPVQPFIDNLQLGAQR